MKIISTVLTVIFLMLSGEAFAEDTPAEDPCIVPTAMDRIRPAPRDEPTDVSISMYVLDFENIDDINQDFTVDVVINQKWHDSRLINQEALKKYPDIRCTYELREVWNPKLTVFNLRDLKPILDKVVTVRPDGTVNYLQRYFGTLTAHLNLRNFPFDKQTFPITLVSTEYGPDQLKLIFNKEDTGHEKRFSIANWKLEPVGATVGKVTAESAHVPVKSGEYSTFQYSFIGQRDLTYYVWKVIIPMTLIVLMSWAVFWVNPRQIEAEVGLSATTILTLIAFLFNLNSLLPRIPYLTNLDFFILFSLILVFLSFIEVVITCSLALSGRDSLAINIDRTARVLFPVFYILNFSYFMLH